MASTTTNGFPYPQSGDPAYVHTDIQALAQAADDDKTGQEILIVMGVYS